MEPSRNPDGNAATFSKGQHTQECLVQHQVVEPFITPEQVVAKLPEGEYSVEFLAQLRFRGTGPVYYKPTSKKVLYRWSEVNAWIESTACTGTAAVA